MSKPDALTNTETGETVEAPVSGESMTLTYPKDSKPLTVKMSEGNQCRVEIIPVEEYQNVESADTKPKKQ